MDGIIFVFSDLTGASAKDLKEHLEYVRSKTAGKTTAVLYSVIEGKPAFVVYVAEPMRSKLTANDIVKYISSGIGGQGGGIP